MLFVFIMSHGDQGVLYDRNGEKGEINEVIKVLKDLENTLPAVSIQLVIM